MTTDKRQAAYRRGLDAEDTAVSLYEEAGYTLIGERIRTPAGEIDLIVSRGDLVVFIEVKQRRSLNAAAEAISPRQQRRITDAAAIWLSRNPSFASHAMRFDAVLITPGGRTRQITDAYQADGF